MPDGEKPSRESMREVKKEYEARRKAEKERAAAAEKYWAEQTGRSKPSSGRTGVVLGVTAVVVVGAVAATALLHLGPFATAATATDAGSPQPSASSPSSSSSAPKATPSTSADDGTDPTVVPVFGDTPAKAWKSGTAAIVMPRATQVGIFRPKQVAEALAKTKAYLVAATVTPRVVFRGQLPPVFATLAPSSVTWMKQQHAKKADPTPWTAIANRFRPGDWRAAAEVRLRGKVTTSPGDQQTLNVHAVYVAAYWLVPAKGGTPHTVAVRREIVLRFYGRGSSHVSAAEIATWYGAISSDSVCGATWRYPDYLQAYADRSAVPVATPSAITGTWDPTDPDAPASVGQGCFTDTSGF